MLFEVSAHPPPLVVGEGVAVLLEEGVDAGNAPVPTVLQVLQGQPSTSSHVTGRQTSPVRGSSQSNTKGG